LVFRVQCILTFMNETKILKIKKGLIVQKVNKETIVYDTEQAKIHTINETASFIFQKIKAQKNIGQIIESLVKKFGITKSKAEDDINDFIKVLVKEKILIK
jgi:hypothetical protein